MKMILNPALLYASLWTLLLFLYSLRFSDLLLPLSTDAFLFFSASISMFLLGYILFIIISKKCLIYIKLNHEIYKEWIFSRHTTKVLSILTKVLIVGLITELIYFQNVPLVSLLGIGKIIRYTEFGFPGIHGLLNATLLVIITILFVRHLYKPSKLNFTLILLAFSWPILLVTRQLFLTIAVQLIFLYILIKGASFKGFVKIILMIFGLIFIFGYIGDLRSGRDGIIALARPTIEYPDYLPSGLLWAYIYIVSPLNNVVNNVNITPYYAPIGTISGLIPSFARNYLIELLGISPPAWELVNETLNVSSMHEKFFNRLWPFL